MPMILTKAWNSRASKWPPGPSSACRHRMHIGVVVGRLEAGQVDQRARVAGDRVGDFLHQLLGAGGVHCLAQARFVEHRYHSFFGLDADGCGQLQFAFHVRGGVVVRGTRRQWQADLQRWQVFGVAEVGLELRIGLCARDRGGARCHVHAFVGVDPALVDGCGLDAGQVLGVLQQELGAPERVLHPRAAQFVQVHAQGEMLDLDALEHVGSTGRERPS